LTYYTSPGAINEKVEAVSVQLSGLEPSGPNDLGTFSGFKSSGVIRSYDALQLIQSAQVGALPEARLEMNIYHLLHQLQIHPGKWLNAPITLSTVDHLTTTTPEDMALAASHPFEATSQSVGFLRHHRTKYYEYGQADSAAVFEHIEPLVFSCNTVITLPVVQYRNQVYVGIEKRHLPVPQLQEGNSLLWAAPAYRVPREVTNRFELQTFIQEKVIFGSKVVSSSRLGEKYLPCIGVTPEQVYPYVVTLDRPSPDLYWMALDDLMHRTAQLRDGHLLICLFRLAHYISYQLR